MASSVHIKEEWGCIPLVRQTPIHAIPLYHIMDTPIPIIVLRDDTSNCRSLLGKLTPILVKLLPHYTLYLKAAESILDDMLVKMGLDKTGRLRYCRSH